jgi:putative ABC transport system permease protein
MFRDLRFAFRQLKKSPAFAIVAVLTLALGIGASTAIFSVVNPILFRPLSYPDAGRVMRVWESHRTGTPTYVCFGTFYGLRERTRSFEALAALKSWQPALVGTGEPARLEGQQVTPEFFRVLGIQPILGRDFQPSDDQYHGPQVVVMSNAAWRTRFAADPEIIGRKITLDDRPYTVIGVLPAFENVLAPEAELWSPLQYNPALPSDGREWGHHLQMIGRLRPGVSPGQAQAESAGILRDLGRLYAKGYDSSGGAPSDLLVYGLQEDIARDVRPALLAIAGGVGLVLLIACVNVTNLLLARGAQRRPEFALRIALGSKAVRVLQQLLTESLLVAFAGGVLAIVFARVAIRILVALSPSDLPRLHAIQLDGAVFAFAFTTSTLVALIVGIVPALQAARSDPQSGLQQSSRAITGKQQLTRRVLVVSEVAIALVLLVSAGLLLRSVQRLFATPPGFNPSHVLTMQVQDYGRYADDAARARLYQSALEAVRQVPGVVDAAFTTQLPLSGDSETFGAEFQAYPNQLSTAAFRYAVSPSYFKTMGIPLLRGRLLTDNDHAGMPVAVVISESFARRMFPGRDPIGQQMRAGPDAGAAGRPWDVVVGVVGDVKQQSLALKNDDAFYTTTTQWAWVDGVQSLVVHTQGDATLLIPALQSAIWSVDKQLPIVRVATMDKLLAESDAQRNFALVLFEAFAVAGLLLAAIGLFAVLSGSVTERTREIGVRAALGATPGNILALVFRQGMTLTVVGLMVGLAGALAAARVLTSLLFGVSGHDPITYIEVAFVLLAVAAIACWIPARRAARVAPAITLRAE